MKIKSESYSKGLKRKNEKRAQQEERNKKRKTKNFVKGY